MNDSLQDKISLFCDVQREAVIPLPTVSSIYFVPLMLEDEGLGQLLVNKLNLKTGEPDLTQWKELVRRLQTPREPINIALVGKYVELHDSYFSVLSAHHAALYYNRDVNCCGYLPVTGKGDADSLLRSAQGIVMPGGFGVRVSGMIKQ